MSRLTTLWQAVGNDDVFEVEVIDPKDEQRDIQEKDSKIEAKVLNNWGVDKRTVWGLFTQFHRSYILI